MRRAQHVAHAFCVAAPTRRTCMQPAPAARRSPLCTRRQRSNQPSGGVQEQGAPAAAASTSAAAAGNAANAAATGGGGGGASTSSVAAASAAAAAAAAAAWAEAGATCIACGIGISGPGFASPAEQRRHFKTDWHRCACSCHSITSTACTLHTRALAACCRQAVAKAGALTLLYRMYCICLRRYNVKRRVARRPPVTEEAFDRIVEDDEDVSQDR